MKTCPNCHQPVAPGSRFCENCGYDLSQAVTSSAVPPEPQRRSASQKKHRRGGKKVAPSTPGGKRHRHQVVLVTTAVIGVVLVVVLFMAAGFYHRQAGRPRQIANITDDITGNQSKDLAQKLVSSDPNMKITSDSVQPFLDYTRLHPGYVKTMKADLLKSGQTRDGSFKVVTAGHTLGVLPIYKVQVKPMHPRVSTNESNATIMANKTAIITAKNDHFSYTAGPLFPGRYVFKLSGAALAASKTVNLITDADRSREVSLNVTAKTAKASSAANDHGDATDIAANTDREESSTTSHDHDTTSGDDTYDYADLSARAEQGIDTASDKFDFDADDYEYKVTEPLTDVLEIKTYDPDDGDHISTYRYDTVHDRAAIYDTDKGKYVYASEYYDE